MSDKDEHVDRATDCRPCSFDLTLKLEQQLEAESLPSTPAAKGRPQSVDTNVLASVITQLRTSLADVTRERDELTNSLFEIKAREADMKDAVAHISEKCSSLQEQLEKAIDRTKEDENTISVLRSKVEESRRGLMRLQSESRRASQVLSPPDLTRAGSLSLMPGKRASFAPMTGCATGRTSTHRRISSVNDTSFEGGLSVLSPVGANFLDTAPQLCKMQTPASRRASGLFCQSSPPTSLRGLDDTAEVETLRKEISALRGELDEVRHELSESNETREASELCVKALRAFIEENDVGVAPAMGNPNSSTRRPSPPLKAREGATTGGWPFRLWKAETLGKDSVPAPAPRATPTCPPVQSPPSQPLTRNLGHFFGARTNTHPAMMPVRRVGTEHDLCSGTSDVSSLDEPVEPVSPVSQPQQPDLVRDANSVVSGSSRDSDASIKKPVLVSSPSAIDGRLTPVSL